MLPAGRAMIAKHVLSEIHETPDGLAYVGGLVGQAGRATRFGVVDAQGNVAPHSDFRTTFARSIWPKGPIDVPENIIRLEGPALFAGCINHMFGHLLTSALGRIWAVDRLPPDTTLHYLVRLHLKTKSEAIAATLYKINALFGVKNPILVTYDSVQADPYYTAQDRYGEAWFGGADTHFVQWVQKRTAQYRSIPIVPGKKLFVSRFRMPTNTGGIACEDILTRNFEAAGFEVFAPEEHSIEEQARQYSESEMIVFTEGSALHLYSFLKKPEQKIAIIQRREMVSKMITSQFYAFDPQPALFLNVIDRMLFPAVVHTNQQIALINFQKCFDALCLFGFLDQNTDWYVPSETEIAEFIAERQRDQILFETEDEWQSWRGDFRKRKQALRARRLEARSK